MYIVISWCDSVKRVFTGFAYVSPHICLCLIIFNSRCAANFLCSRSCFQVNSLMFAFRKKF